MKRLFVLLTFLCLTVFSNAQDSNSLKQLLCFQQLNDSTKNLIGFGCGNVGSYTENLYLIQYLISEKRFDLIGKLLDSKIVSTRYLAIVTLLRADKKSICKLNSELKLRIESFKNDNETTPLCIGCTGHWSFSIKSIFDKKSKSILYKSTKDWIDDSLKKID